MIAVEATGPFTCRPPRAAPAVLPAFFQGLLTVGGTGLLVGQKFFRSTEATCSFSGVSSSRLDLSCPSRRRVRAPCPPLQPHCLLSQHQAPQGDSQALSTLPFLLPSCFARASFPLLQDCLFCLLSLSLLKLFSGKTQPLSLFLIFTL